MDLLTLAMAKKYVKESLAGAGALRGEKGYSAYEIAVQNGFLGSESEWLASLKGQTPNIGEDGNWHIGSINTGVSATPVLNYNLITDKPTINGIEIVGDLLMSDLGIEPMSEADVNQLF